MKNFLLAAGMIVFLASCSKKNNQDAVIKPNFDSTAVEANDLAAEPIVTNCYASTSDKDSLFLSFEDNLGTVTGKMSYKNHEKDSSKGDLSGLLSGDTLKITYTFEAEGKTSNKEIWFLKKGSDLVEGTAPYDASGEVYADTKKVKFEKGHILKPSDCKNVEKNLQ